MPASKITVFNNAIYRVPLFPLDATLTDSWDKLKSAIAESSPEFYALVKEVTAGEIDKLPKKVILTIYKYFNRAKYRPVPYGTFTGIGLMKPERRPTTGPLQVESSLVEHRFADWSTKDTFSFGIADLIARDAFLFANSSYYRVGLAIRYVYRSEDGFELQDVPATDELLSILSACQRPVKIEEVVALLNSYGLSPQEASGQLDELIQAQLLFSSLSSNIIGQDYFDRISIDTGSIQRRYLISERAYLGGGLDKRLIQHLPRAVRILQQLKPTAELPVALADFKDRFLSKFDGQEVPIMVALDPEIGVGYGALEQPSESGGLVHVLNRGHLGDRMKPSLGESFARQLKIQQPQVIFLDKIPIDEEDTHLPIPNTLTAMVAPVDDLLLVEYIGGCTANAIAGRFTLSIDEIHTHCQSLAELEQKANSQVVFFDIGYTAETGVDNVNRRRSIYDYQLSILEFDTSARPLTLDDIMVSVRDGEVILRSVNLDQRLVPRFASAYNYSRSDLPVFRLLCDLQHQGLQTDLSLDLRLVLPGLSFYPRLQYKNLVLSPAMWILHPAGLQVKMRESLPVLQSYLKSLGIVRYCKLGIGDQKICIDVDSQIDLEFFRTEWNKVGVVTVEEAFIPNMGAVQDEHGRTYYSQFILALTHTDRLFNPLAKQESVDQAAKRSFYPGSEWLYLELYCHPQRADELIKGPIRQFLTESGRRIDQWFFVRYNKNGHHLRLRFRQKEFRCSQYLLEALLHILRPEMDNGIVSDLQQKTYRRELERYHPSLIEPVEEHFCVDSEYVLALLDEPLSDHDKYRLCIGLALDIQKQHFPMAAFLEMAQRMFHSFGKEHHLTRKEYASLAGVQTHLETAEPVTWQAENVYLPSLLQSFHQVLGSCANGRKDKMFVDLFHMHINRLFMEHQRTHELIIYYLISRVCLKIVAMQLPSADIERKRAAN